MCYELIGSPVEFNDEDETQWDGPDGIINLIREFCGFSSGRARTQIRSVLTFVSKCINNGDVDIDAGVKVGATNSGRHAKLTREENELLAKTLSAGFGIDMTTEIVNQHRIKAGKSSVDESTIRRSAHKVFNGVCHNRPMRKTGSKAKTG